VSAESLVLSAERGVPACMPPESLVRCSRCTFAVGLYATRGPIVWLLEHWAEAHGGVPPVRRVG
jgi:hypothetical protein